MGADRALDSSIARTNADERNVPDAASILKEAKAEILPYDPRYGVPAGDHEHSTCRMGADPKRSALNGFCRCTREEVFVVDGAAFTTASEKNPR